jgi:hypothetical protein
MLVLGYILLHKQNITGTQKMLLIEKNKWKSLNLETYEYAVIYDSNGYTMRYNSTISVKDNRFYSETLNDEYRTSIEQFSDDYLLTIDNLYDYLEEIIMDYKNEKINLLLYYRKNITIKYDLIYHIPNEIIFRYYKSPFLTDIPTWVSIRIENFKEMK